MERQPTLQTTPGGQLAATAATAPSLPDINAATYPFETVKAQLDQAAVFHLFSLPGADGAGALVAGGEVVGFHLRESLHRLSIALAPPTVEGGIRAANALGERIGGFEHRWLLVPDDFAALPDREPPPTPLDPSRSQRFAMLDSVCHLAGGDGFRGFGTGRTFPVPAASAGSRPQLLAAAVGTILEGFGRFRGLTDGTYTYCGSLSRERGFTGSLLLRVADPSAILRSAAPLPPPVSHPWPEPGVTYLAFHGEKRDPRQKTTYIVGADGDVDGLYVEQQLLAVELDAACAAASVAAHSRIGPAIGSMTARIGFRLLHPMASGTALSPIPFQSYNTFTLADAGGRMVGTIGGNGDEGRTFNLTLPALPGQRALRFGGFGMLMKGSGGFQDARGLMVDNSAVGIAPHALATLYVLRLDDPAGRYRATAGGWR